MCLRYVISLIHHYLPTTSTTFYEVLKPRDQTPIFFFLSKNSLPIPPCLPPSSLLFSSFFFLFFWYSSLFYCVCCTHTPGAPPSPSFCSACFLKRRLLCKGIRKVGTPTDSECVCYTLGILHTHTHTTAAKYRRSVSQIGHSWLELRARRTTTRPKTVCTLLMPALLHTVSSCVYNFSRVPEFENRFFFLEKKQNTHIFFCFSREQCRHRVCVFSIIPP